MEQEKINLGDLKLAFAAEMLRCDGDAFKAAFAIESDSGLALQIAHTFPKDEIVLKEQQRLMQSGDTAKQFLPTKEAQAKNVYAIAIDATKDVEERLKAHRLYAEIMGHIEKPVNGQSVNILNQGVMIVREAGSGTDEEWAEKASQQQKTLIGHVN